MYKINETYFTNISTEEQAYLLAWFWSRGSAHIQVSLSKVEALFLICRAIKYTGEVHQYKSICDLNITNSAFQAHLIKAGCVINRHIPQIFPPLKTSLLYHFLRGIFDSYGTIIFARHKYINLSIIYNDHFISILREFLRSYLNIDTKHYYRYSHTNTIQMLITNTKDSIKFLNYLYFSSNYYLTRNFEKYKLYIEKGV